MADEPQKYVFTDDMREISGFGGTYEDACRAMVVAGLNWLDEHPEATPTFKGFTGVFGLCEHANDDGERLSDAMVAPTGGDCTGAMHEVTVRHVLQIRATGWDEYCRISREAQREKEASVQKSAETSVQKR
jgi:hypothetical protein